MEQQVEILEVHIWGLRDGVKIAIEGYIEENDNWRIKASHTFDHKERDNVDERGKKLRSSKNFSSSKSLDSPGSSLHRSNKQSQPHDASQSSLDGTADLSPSSYPAQPVEAASNVIFRPSKQIKLPTNDINLDVEHRYAAQYGLSVVTAVAHVWFNAWFEGHGPEKYTEARQGSANNKDIPGTPWANDSGVFEIKWELMDGIKGSKNKGTRAFDKVAVVWKV